MLTISAVTNKDFDSAEGELMHGQSLTETQTDRQKQHGKRVSRTGQRMGVNHPYARPWLKAQAFEEASKR